MFQIMYRDKTREYFDALLRNHAGVQYVCPKDNGGHPACPINGAHYLTCLIKIHSSC